MSGLRIYAKTYVELEELSMQDTDTIKEALGIE